MIGLSGWQAYLWDQALAWLDEWDAGAAQRESAPPPPTYGAHG